MYTSVSEFYKSREWEKLLEILKLERVDDTGQVICSHCHKPITRKYDCIGHHRIELTEQNVNDPDISLNPDNIALVHFRCHNLIHRRFEGFYQQVYLVYGPPCAGKTTWVDSVANDDDLIIDIDRIWECLCNSDRYHKPNRIKANVFGVRDALVDMVKIRKGMWRNAYIIGTYPLRTDRDRICSLLRAREVFIFEKKDICLSRASSDSWKEFIEEWFDDYVE